MQGVLRGERSAATPNLDPSTRRTPSIDAVWRGGEATRALDGTAAVPGAFQRAPAIWLPSPRLDNSARVSAKDQSRGSCALSWAPPGR